MKMLYSRTFHEYLAFLFRRIWSQELGNEVDADCSDGIQRKDQACNKHELFAADRTIKKKSNQSQNNEYEMRVDHNSQSLGLVDFFPDGASLESLYGGRDK